MHKRYLWALAGALLLATGAARPAHAGPPPANWKNEDINGATGGKTDVTGTGAAAVWTLTGTGDDIWGSADSFQFAYTTLPKDGGITARILSQKGGHDDGWAKTGTMLRENTTGESRCAYMVYCNGEDYPDRPGRAFEPSFRQNEGETPNRGVGGDLGPANDSNMGRRIDKGLGPIYIRSQRKGKLYQHWLSDDGKDWALISEQTIDIDPGKPILAGLCACQHGGDVPVVVQFDNVSVSDEVIVRPRRVVAVEAFPGPGAVLLTYGSFPNAVGYNVYRREVGQPKDKAVLVNAKGPNPYTWLIDTGPDGKGLANGTHYLYSVKAVVKDAAGKLSESPGSADVMVLPQTPILPGYALYYWNTVTPATVTVASNVLTIKASGGDIWDVADEGAFLATPVAGDYTITAKVLEKPVAVAPNTSNNVKAGPMIREGVGPSDRYAYLFTTSGRGVLWERRVKPLGAENQGQAGTGDDDTPYPLWLKMTKAGAKVTAFQSKDGTAYDPVADVQDFGQMKAVTYVGIAVSSGNKGLYGSAKFDATSIKIQ